MKTIDLPSWRMIWKFIVLVVVSSVMMVSCYVYHNYDTFKSIKVVVNENTSVEYGTPNYDINSLIKKVEGKIVSVKQDVDTNKMGDQEVVVEVKKENVVREITFLVKVIDTIAPEIKLKKQKVTITQGDNYDLTSNIEAVKDVVDGNIAFSKDAKADSNFYYNFSYGKDIDSVGKHEVTVTAKDKSGNASKMKFTLEVKPKPVATPSVPLPAMSGNAPANAAGGDIVSIAYSLVGSPYISGSNGPYGFDCSGFVQYVYSRAGKSVSRSSYTQAYDGVGVSYANAQPGDILSWGHGGSVTHSALYVGNGLMIHATNPSQGVVVSSVSGWQNASIDNLMAVRRIN